MYNSCYWNRYRSPLTVQYKSFFRGTLIGTGLVFGSQTIKFIAHTFYKKNVLVQLVKARVYYVQ